MMRLAFTSLLSILLLSASAQNDSTSFRGHFINKEYNIFLKINLYDQDITIPGQEFYGPLPGYLGKNRYTSCWPVVKADVEEQKAILTLVNDYGSEDLTATLTRENDTLYVFRQKDGSPLKMPEKGKWQKLPRVLEFVKH